MGLFLEGIWFGLVLAILLGPIFIVLIHSSIENGKSAGFSVASGVWFSDVLFIGLSYFFINRIGTIVKSDAFDYWMSLIGGLVLCLFGVVAFFKKSKFSKEELEVGFSQKIGTKELSESESGEKNRELRKSKNKGVFGFFTRGFLVNTVNPFTFVFWLSIMTSNVIGRDLDHYLSFVFLSGIFITIVFTDVIKVFLAEEIRKRMNQKYFNLLTKASGIGLFGFGIYIMIRAFL